MNTCPLSCGSDLEPRTVDAGGVTLFICPECLGVAFDAAILCDPRRPIDLSRILRPVVENIRRENSIDPLTQTKNRAFFFKRLSAEIAAAHHRVFISAAAFAFDIEALYSKHGSWRGDAMIQSLAASLYASVRQGDDFARVEAHVFGLILRNADKTTAHEIATRIADGARTIPTGNGKPIEIPIVVAIAPADGQTPEAVWSDLMNRLRIQSRRTASGGWTGLEA